MEFKVGDKVRLKEAIELNSPDWKSQEYGAGEIVGFFQDYKWASVRWENDASYVYPITNLIKETNMRTIPTKEQVLKAASKCPQTKDVLKILFPEDFKPTPIDNAYKHFAILNGTILVSPQVQERLNCGVWEAKFGCRGPQEILNHPMFDGWFGYYASGEELKKLISNILALEGE